MRQPTAPDANVNQFSHRVVSSIAALLYSPLLLAVEPPAGTAVTFNNIGLFNSTSGSLQSCVALRGNDDKVLLDATGKPQILAITLVLRPPELVFRLSGYSAFDTGSGKDCSGSFKGGVYSDKVLMQYPGYVLDGKVLGITLDYIPGSPMEFRLRTDAASFGVVRNFTGNTTQLGSSLGDFQGNSVRDFSNALPPSIKLKLPTCSDPQGDDNKVVLELNGSIVAQGIPGTEYTLSTSLLAAGDHQLKAYCSDEAAIRSIATTAGLTPDARHFGQSSYATGIVRMKVPVGSTTPGTSTTQFNFQFDSATSSSDQQLIRETMEFARSFLQTTFGRTLQRSPTIATSTTAAGCVNGGGAAFTGPQSVTICTANSGWTVHGTVNKQKILIHELFHVLQFELQWLGNSSNNTGPHWLIEGAAEYVGWLGVTKQGGLGAFETAHGCMLKEVADFAQQQPPGLPNLSELLSAQSFSRPGPMYALSMLGVEKLLTTVGIDALLTYGNALASGTAAAAAFETAFGSSPSVFYAEFPVWKAAQTVPTTYLCRI